MEINEMQAIIEAIIYVAEDPVKTEQLLEVFPDENLVSRGQFFLDIRATNTLEYQTVLKSAE